MKEGEIRFHIVKEGREKLINDFRDYLWSRNYKGTTVLTSISRLKTLLDKGLLSEDAIDDYFRYRGRVTRSNFKTTLRRFIEFLENRN